MIICVAASIDSFSFFCIRQQVSKGFFVGNLTRGYIRLPLTYKKRILSCSDLQPQIIQTFQTPARCGSHRNKGAVVGNKLPDKTNRYAKRFAMHSMVPDILCFNRFERTCPHVKA